MSKEKNKKIGYNKIYMKKIIIRRTFLAMLFLRCHTWARLSVRGTLRANALTLTQPRHVCDGR